MEEVLCNHILNVNSYNYSDLIYEAINTFAKLWAVVKKKKEFWLHAHVPSYTV